MFSKLWKPKGLLMVATALVPALALAGASLVSNVSTADAQVPPCRNLTVSVTDNADPTPVGNVLGYNVVVQNTGGCGAAGIRLTAQLDPRVGFWAVANMNPASGFGCAYVAGLNQVRCWGGVLPAGGSATIGIQVVPVAAAAGNWITLAAAVDPNNLIPETFEFDNNATEPTFVIP